MAQEDLSQNVIDALKNGSTIVRTLIDMTAVLTAAGTGGNIFLGIAMVSDDAVAASAFPDPDVNYEPVSWMWRTARTIFTDSPNDSAQATRFSVDLRGKRKFQMGENNLYLLINAGALTANINLDGTIRFLLMYR